MLQQSSRPSVMETTCARLRAVPSVRGRRDGDAASALQKQLRLKRVLRLKSVMRLTPPSLRREGTGAWRLTPLGRECASCRSCSLPSGGSPNWSNGMTCGSPNWSTATTSWPDPAKPRGARAG